MRFRELSLLLFFCLTAAALALPTPVPSEMLDGKALVLPVGKIAPPSEEYTWHSTDGTFLALHKTPGTTPVLLGYFEESLEPSVESVRDLVQRMLASLDLPVNSDSLSVRESETTWLGQSFQFMLTDPAAPSTFGLVGITQDQVLIVMGMGENSRVPVEAVRAKFVSSSP